jgi:hypothetical protein
MRVARVFFVTLVCAAAGIIIASAAESSSATYLRAEIDKYAGNLRAQQTEMQANGWSPAEFEEYLNTVLWYVYSGKVLANTRFDQSVASTNLDLTNLVQLGILPFWPANPINNWEPVKVLTPQAGYSAGDLCFALCPERYASFNLSGGLVCTSFDLYAYASEASLATFGAFSLAQNVEWDTPPTGALYGLAFYTTPEYLYQANLKKSAQ